MDISICFMSIRVDPLGCSRFWRGGLQWTSRLSSFLFWAYIDWFIPYYELMKSWNWLANLFDSAKYEFYEIFNFGTKTGLVWFSGDLTLFSFFSDSSLWLLTKIGAGEFILFSSLFCDWIPYSRSHYTYFCIFVLSRIFFCCSSCKAVNGFWLSLIYTELIPKVFDDWTELLPSAI